MLIAGKIAGKIAKHKGQSDFDKDQLMMARRRDQSVSKTAALSPMVQCLVPTKCAPRKDNQLQGQGCPKLSDVHGERRLVPLHKTPVEAQIAQKVNFDYNRKVSEHTVLLGLLCIEVAYL